MDVTSILDHLLSLEMKKDPVKYHPEDNLLSHVTQAFELAKEESLDHKLWVAALLHDIGKSIQNKDHPEVGVKLLRDLGYVNEMVLNLIDNHMRIRWFLSSRMKRQKKLDKLLNNQYLSELVHLRRIDAASRLPNVPIVIDMEEVSNLLIETNTS